MRTTLKAFPSALGALSLAAILALTMTACSADEDHVAEGGANPVNASSEPDGTNESAPADNDTASPDAMAAAQACFLGSWDLDPDSYLQSVADVQQIQNASGAVTVTFVDDGTVTTTYNDWAYDVVVEIGSQTNTDSMVRNGTDSGTYYVSEDGIAAITDTAVESEVTTVSTKYSNTVTTTENTGFSMFRTAPITCEGDHLTVAVRDDRSVTLTREG